MGVLPSQICQEPLGEATAVLATDPEVRGKFLADKTKEDQEEAEIQSEARKLQAESRRLSEESKAKLRPRERLAMALTFLQIAIALAAITVPTKRRWLLWSSVVSTAIGMVTAATAFA